MPKGGIKQQAQQVHDHVVKLIQDKHDVEPSLVHEHFRALIREPQFKMQRNNGGGLVHKLLSMARKQATPKMMFQKYLHECAKDELKKGGGSFAKDLKKDAYGTLGVARTFVAPVGMIANAAEGRKVLDTRGAEDNLSGHSGKPSGGGLNAKTLIKGALGVASNLPVVGPMVEAGKEAIGGHESLDQMFKEAHKQQGGSVLIGGGQGGSLLIGGSVSAEQLSDHLKKGSAYVYHHYNNMSLGDWKAHKETAKQMLGFKPSAMWGEMVPGLPGGELKPHLHNLKTIMRLPTGQSAADLVEHNEELGGNFKSTLHLVGTQVQRHGPHVVKKYVLPIAEDAAATAIASAAVGGGGSFTKTAKKIAKTTQQVLHGAAPILDKASAVAEGLASDQLHNATQGVTTRMGVQGDILGKATGGGASLGKIAKTAISKGLIIAGYPGAAATVDSGGKNLKGGSTIVGGGMSKWTPLVHAVVRAAVGKHGGNSGKETGGGVIATPMKNHDPHEIEKLIREGSVHAMGGGGLGVEAE